MAAAGATAGTGAPAAADSAAAAEDAKSEPTASEKIHLLLEEPSSSRAAYFVSTFILLCIVASSVCYIVETMPRFEHRFRQFWLDAELFFVIVFSVEYVLRFLTTPLPKHRFVLSPMNMIDLIAIAPYYAQLAVMYVSMNSVWIPDLRIIRIVRLFRIFRVGSWAKSFSMIVSAVRGSKEALVLLLFFVCIAAIMFASVMYTLEQGTWSAEKGCYVRPGEDQCSPFQSIPEALYWAITTITTVGYGDVLPTTDVSKGFCAIVMVCGILVLALPVTMIGVAFSAGWADCQDAARLHQAREEFDSPAKVQEHLRKTAEELGALKAHSQVIFEDIGRLLAENIARAEGITVEEASERLSPSYELLSRATVVAVDDLEGHVSGLLRAERGEADDV